MTEQAEIPGESKVDWSLLGMEEPQAEPEAVEPDIEPDTDTDPSHLNPDDEQPIEAGEADIEPDAGWSESDEDIARRFGWKPRTEWKGEVPPTFVDDPREFLSGKTKVLDEFSSVKEQLDATRRELLRIQQQQEEQTQTQSQSKIARLEADYEKAFDVGDKKKAQELLDEIIELKSKAASAPKPEYDPVVQQATQSNVFQDWAQQNPWYLGNSFEDAAKRHYADQVGPQLLQQRGLSPQDVMANPQLEREFYNAVAQEVNRAYGGQQTIQQQASTPKVPSQSGRQPATQRRVKNDQSFEKLPAEAKASFEYLANRKKIYTADDKGRAEYARDYFATQKS
jgi:hypothetical protein